MKTITEKLTELIARQGISQNKLSQLIGCDFANLNKMINGERNFEEDKIHKIAPILEVSPEMIKGWIVADKYPKNILKLALEARQKPLKPVEIPQKKIKSKNQSILTAEIDERIIQKGTSRTKLSTLIGQNQGGLNNMIIGKRSMSPAAIQKLASFFEITEDEIRSWIVADKYSLEALQVATDA